MRRWLTALGSIVIGAGIVVILGPAVARAAPDEARVRTALADVRLPFIANQGQVDARVAFYAPTFAGTLFVTRQGELVYALTTGTAGARRGGREAVSSAGWTLSERLAGGRSRPVGEDPSVTRVSYFLGNDPARWRSGVTANDQVGLGEVWPGVTVSLRARGRSVEKVFTVRPGTSVARIRVRVGGATGLAVDADGALVAHTGLGPVTFTAPVAYQERDGVRRPVAVSYRVTGREYGFTVGAYDRSAPLVIDPLLQSSYVGGNGVEIAIAVAVHPATGDVYVGGQTSSTNFPHALGAALPAIGGGTADAFVARLNGSLTTFIQSTYLGGNGFERVDALAIHPATGDVYVTGNTQSTNFPGAGGGAQPIYGGSGDTYVVRLNAALTTLFQATYLGGSSGDLGYGIAIHPATGDVYVAGSTASANFPHTAGGAQPTYGGSGDAYVARLNAGLTAIIQATYVGGSGTEFGFNLAIHPVTGDVYVAGNTTSTSLSATSGSAQPTYGGGSDDGFVARLNSSLVALLQTTYLGGSGSDPVTMLAIHPMTGDVYAAGGTDSADFPGTSGGAQASYAGAGDVFVARLTSSLTSILQATYLGGSDTDSLLEPGNGLAIHPISGMVYVAGLTSSTNFPGIGGGAQTAVGGGFVARLTGSLTSIAQATYFNDNASAIAIHPTTGHVYVAGTTTSAAFPAVTGGAQSTFGGGSLDGFVSRLTYSLAAVDGLGLSALVNQPTFTTGQTLKLSIGVIDPGLPGVASFFLAIIRPDGLFEFITGSGSVVGPLASIAPLVTGIPLSTPFSVSVPNLITRQWTGTEPRGNYVFIVVAFGGGQVLGVGSASYAFP